MIYPGDKVPQLSLLTVSGDRFTLSEQNPEKFTVVVFYRGKHCPLCLNHLKEIQDRHQKIVESGMNIVAVSMDDDVKAKATAKSIIADDESLPSFPIAYGLTEKVAREWGLYISSKRPNTNEPDVFSEPGLFVIKPDNTVFMLQTQSGPFTRPSMDQLVFGLNYAHENNYPLRGNLTEKGVDSQ